MGRLLLAGMAVAVLYAGAVRADVVRHQALRELGGDFTLTDHRGERFSLHDARGKVVLLFFGFTACSSTCPAIMSKLSTALRRLGPLAERVQPVMVSVDPRRDTPEVLATYVRKFHPGILGLTGSEEEIEAVSARFRAPAHEHRPVDGAYQVDHSSYIFVLDRSGTVVRLIRFEEGAEKIARVARALLEEAEPAATAPGSAPPG
jgi:protein SCO1/2